MAGYIARFNCPGCGSPLEIQEGTISVRCRYCNLVMRVGAPGRILKYRYESHLDDFALKFCVERHFKDNGLLLNFQQVKRQLYFLPFYRFRGMSYTLLSQKKLEEEDVEPGLPVLPTKITFEQRCRNFDLTIPAFADTTFGLDSLGVRPEVIPLSIFIKEDLPPESVVVDLSVSPDDARTTSMGMFAFNLGFASEGKECLISEMIGEGLTVIYYPVWGYSIGTQAGESTLFVDGLAKRVIKEVPGVYEYAPEGSDVSKAGVLTPVAHKCPNCGFDLPTSEFSLHYFCSNCARSYIISGDSYESISTVSADFEPGDGHYPFWRFRFSTGGSINTVGGFSKILTGEIPLIAKDKAQMPFYLYVPAFKSADLDTLTARCLRLSRIQPLLELGQDGLKPVAEMVLAENDALELAGFYWKVIKSRYRFLDNPLYEFKSENAGRGELVWLTMQSIQRQENASVKRQVRSRG